MVQEWGLVRKVVRCLRLRLRLIERRVYISVSKQIEDFEL